MDNSDIEISRDTARLVAEAIGEIEEDGLDPAVNRFFDDLRLRLESLLDGEELTITVTAGFQPSQE